MLDLKKQFKLLKLSDKTLVISVAVILIITISFLLINKKTNEENFPLPVLENIRKNDYYAKSRQKLCENIPSSKLTQEDIEDYNNISNYGPIKYLREKLDERFKAKFILIQIGPAIGGGDLITFMLQERPYQLFDAWVYDYHNGTYDLRGFDLHELNDNEANIEEIQKGFIDQICNDAYGI